jgi:hypothetical protein
MAWSTVLTLIYFRFKLISVTIFVVYTNYIENIYIFLILQDFIGRISFNLLRAYLFPMSARIVTDWDKELTCGKEDL